MKTVCPVRITFVAQEPAAAFQCNWQPQVGHDSSVSLARLAVERLQQPRKPDTNRNNLISPACRDVQSVASIHTIAHVPVAKANNESS